MNETKKLETKMDLHLIPVFVSFSHEIQCIFFVKHMKSAYLIMKTNYPGLGRFFRAHHGSRIMCVSVTTKLHTKITAGESKTRTIQTSPTDLTNFLWRGGRFSSIKNRSLENSVGGCGRNRGSNSTQGSRNCCRMQVVADREN